MPKKEYIYYEERLISAQREVESDKLFASSPEHNTAQNSNNLVQRGGYNAQF